jgi:hypothetical protein
MMYGEREPDCINGSILGDYGKVEEEKRMMMNNIET